MAGGGPGAYNGRCPLTVRLRIPAAPYWLVARCGVSWGYRRAAVPERRRDAAGLVSVQTVGGAWGEYSVTYATLPAMGTAVQVFPVSQAGAYVTVDVTTVVRGWVGVPATNNGLALTAVTAVVQFDTKENDLTGHGASWM